MEDTVHCAEMELFVSASVFRKFCWSSADPIRKKKITCWLDSGRFPRKSKLVPAGSACSSCQDRAKYFGETFFPAKTACLNRWTSRNKSGLSGKRQLSNQHTNFSGFHHFVLSWLKHEIFGQRKASCTVCFSFLDGKRKTLFPGNFSFLVGEKHFSPAVLVLIRLLPFFTATYNRSKMPCSSRISPPDRTVQSGDIPENALKCMRGNDMSNE